jgi:hypothetical protein
MSVISILYFPKNILRKLLKKIIITPKGVYLLTMGRINHLLIINFNLRVGN